MNRSLVGAAVLLICTAWSVPAAAVPINWGFTDLGSIDGSFVGPVPLASTAIGIGQAFVARGGVGSFSYSGSTIADLSSLDGASGGSFFVNAAGQVAGQSYGGLGASTQAFLYSGHAFTNVGSLGGNSTYVTGLNASGEVVGYSAKAGNASTHAFSYANG
jgi:probable HAF family extracellular repeat protein